MPKISDEQLRHKLQEGRNYKHLYHELKAKFDEIKEENKHLRLENQELKEAVATLKIQMAELQTMVFGKKKKPPTGHYEPLASSLPLPLRTKASFRRPLPPASAVTSELPVPLPATCTCGGSFKQVTYHERYEEDIPLPDLTKDYTAHLVTKYVIERGVCSACSKATSGKDLGGQAVSLGSNVRLLVTHLIGVMGLSYAQVSQLFASLYNFHLTDGEIADIIATQHKRWLPAYGQLLADIRSSPSVNIDETSWPIQTMNRQGYAWVVAAGDSPKSCFALANSRGAPHAKKLLKDYSGIRITDDYGVYRNPDLKGSQQLCWAHLYRCIRDLRYNENLPKEHEAYVSWWYQQFADIYQQLRSYLAKPYDQNQRAEQATALWQRVQALCDRHSVPVKLAKLKA